MSVKMVVQLGSIYYFSTVNINMFVTLFALYCNNLYLISVDPYSKILISNGVVTYTESNKIRYLKYM